MQSIAEWLEEVGLGEYAQCFAENGIDFSILDHLSDGDLKELGVCCLAIGASRRPRLAGFGVVLLRPRRQPRP